MSEPAAERIEQLECPKCGLKGVAAISDHSAHFGGDHDAKVDAVSAGFEAVERDSPLGGVDVICARCGASAVAARPA